MNELNYVNIIQFHSFNNLSKALTYQITQKVQISLKIIFERMGRNQEKMLQLIIDIIKSYSL